MLSKSDLEKNGKIPVYSSDTSNNGIIGYTNIDAEFIVSEENPIYLIFGDHTRSLNIAYESFNVTDNVKVLTLKDEYSIKILLYIISSWQKTIPNLGYSRHWSIAKNALLNIPTQNGSIDFAFMENFIAELEAERIAELEAERIAELEAYLSATGLQDYLLTVEEEKALKEFDNWKFEEFRIIDIFDVKNSGNILSRDIMPNSGTTPYLSASTENNAVSSYISYDEDYIDKGDCVFIGGKTFVVTYQEKDFYSNDSHNLILYLKEKEEKSKFNQLFLATCVKIGLGYKYSWGDSISNKKIQTDTFSLPSTKGVPAYAYMEVFIKAVQKLVIKEVVEYADRKIEATREVVKK